MGMPTGMLGATEVEAHLNPNSRVRRPAPPGRRLSPAQLWEAAGCAAGRQDHSAVQLLSATKRPPQFGCVSRSTGHEAPGPSWLKGTNAHICETPGLSRSHSPLMKWFQMVKVVSVSTLKEQKSQENRVKAASAAVFSQ